MANRLDTNSITTAHQEIEETAIKETADLNTIHEQRNAS